MKIQETVTVAQTDKNEFQKLLNVDITKLDNQLLAKLVEEVRNEDGIIDTTYYNRFHNRHNRS